MHRETPGTTVTELLGETMTDDRISVTGVVASAPKHIVTSEGLHITSFRLASNSRRYDRAAQSWVDADTNWYTVTTFRQLASNISVSVVKGERVAVQGKLRVRSWTSGEKSGTQVEIEADSVGHDLTWGISSYTKTLARAESANAGQAATTAAASASAPEERGEGAGRPDEFVAEAGATDLLEGWPAAAAAG